MTSTRCCVCHEVLDERLRSAGRGRIEYLYPPAGRAGAVWEQAIDGFHHIGTTRMSAVPADGVVDGDCRVHGVDNLFIASSSVLRTSAEANPTFTAVCLALRLAHHIAEGVGHDANAAVDVREPGGDPDRRERRVKLAG